MHQNPPVERHIGSPEATIILVHGRTLDAAYMSALADRLALDNVRYIFPQADANTWYPKGFLAPLAENEPNLSAALAHYDSIVTGLLNQGLPPDRLVIGGFSQGACLTAEYLARHPRRYRAAILWTGGLIGPPGTAWPLAPEIAGMPVYLTTSRTDPFVPAQRVEETNAWLSASGARPSTTIFAEREHLVSNEEIIAARGLIAPWAAAPVARIGGGGH